MTINLVYLNMMSKRSFLTVITLVLVIIISAAAVFLAKGYSFSPESGKIVGTGIISITSVPEGASVYIDGHLNTATNATISLAPKSYDIRVVREGFIPWERNVDVKEGLVTDLKLTLFPAIPTIYPLSFNGVSNLKLSPDGQNLAYAVPIATVSGSLRQRGGLWVWRMVSQPISFVRGGEPHQLVSSTSSVDFSKATLRFSPDSQQILATLQEGGLAGQPYTRNYLLEVDQSNQDPRDVTPTLATLLKSWDEDHKTRESALIQTIRVPDIRNVASASASLVATTSGNLKWSPDETKIMVLKPKAVVYDLENGQSYTLPEAKSYQWLPDSTHVVLVQEGKIAVADYDGTNVAVVYAGNFDPATVFPWPDASRLVFVTSFPTPTASQPNLYGINLK